MRSCCRATRSSSCKSSAPCVIFVRAGKYYLEETIQLGVNDTNLIISAYNNEIVVLSGATPLPKLKWSRYDAVPGAFRAPFKYSDPRVEEWIKSHGLSKAGPPPKISALFANGERQIRARHPNGNPLTKAGLCFSASQRNDEKCLGSRSMHTILNFNLLLKISAYSSCAIGASGNLPAPPAVSTISLGPNRGHVS